MRKIWGNPWIGLVFRLVLAGVLIYAGAIKLFEPDGARDAIVAYRIFGGSIPSILGWVMPIAEVIIGLLLWFNLVCQVILVGAAWIAVGAADAGVDLTGRRKRVRAAR